MSNQLAAREFDTISCLATPEQKLAMVSQALTAATDIYKENGCILALIEEKAQKAAILSGIFLAAAFSFLRKETLGNLLFLLGWYGLGILATAITLTLFSVGASAMTLWVRRMNMPPDSEIILTNVDLRLRVPDGPTEEMQRNNLRDQVRVWNECIRSQRAAIEEKAGYLLWTQGLLFAGICVVFVLLCLTIFAYGMKEIPYGQMPH